MDLANMLRQGVKYLIAFCLNDARHQALIDVLKYADENIGPCDPLKRSKVSMTS